MPGCLRDGSAQTAARAAALRIEVDDQLFSHSILTPDQPVPVLTMQDQAPGRVVLAVNPVHTSHKVTSRENRDR